jgi:hypothetical protein
MLRSIFKKEDPRFPRSEIVAINGEHEGKPAVALVNSAYQQYPYKAQFPWHVHIEIQLEETTEQGLPTDAEGAVLTTVEDGIEYRLGQTCAVHYIGRRTWNGTRALDYYVEDGELARRILQSISDRQTARGFTFTVKKDENWEICDAFYQDP